MLSNRECSIVCWVFRLSLLFFASGLWGQDAYPRKPIQIIVPFAVGGGSDTFVRILTRAIQESNLSEQPLTVINVPGAGGTIGSRRARHAPSDGYTLLNLHEGIITAKYSGNVNYGPEAFEPVAGTGRVDMVLAVADGSRFQSLESVMETIESDPDTVRFSANLGAPSHFAGLLLEAKTREGRFRFVQFGGGAKRFSSLIGEHADVSVFSVSELLQFRSGGLRALAVLSEKRSPALEDVPTAAELGVDLQFSNTQFWWVPRGTDPKRKTWIAELLASAMSEASVRDQLAMMHIDPIFLSGKSLSDQLQQKESAIRALAIRRPVAVPGFGTGLGGMFALLLVVFVGDRIRSWNHQRVPSSSGKPLFAWGRLFGNGVSVLVYLGFLSFRVVPFAWLTWGFVAVLAVGLSDQPRRHWLLGLALGFVLGFGLDGLFRGWLGIDLPG